MRLLVKMFLAAFVVALPVLSSAAEIQSITITDFGIVTSSGSKGGSNPLITEHTDRIPAKRGLRFGVRYLINGMTEGEEIKIGLTWVSPGIRSDTGDVVYSQESLLKRMTGASYFGGYTFENDRELVPGVWKVVLSFEGKKLAEKVFNVYKP